MKDTHFEKFVSTTDKVSMHKLGLLWTPKQRLENDSI